MAEKDARPLDYLDALPTDGGKVRPPMPDDGTLYEWDEDFGWIEAMPTWRQRPRTDSALLAELLWRCRDRAGIFLTPG